MTGLRFAPGEDNVAEQSFSPSIILFWMRTRLRVSSTRVLAQVANSVLGVIPAGSAEAAYPLANVASVGVNVRFSLARALFGVLFFLAGITLLDSVLVLGVLLLLWAVSLAANVLSATLTIQNNGGGVSIVPVSILEKSKLERFREDVNHRLFADHQRIRHTEHMHTQHQQLSVQQQQLNTQLGQRSNEQQGL